MTLPDERPRQSVANLIGRFEQQGKRQGSPGAVSVVPRSSSVSSQITGDAANEELKEKREWPPKPSASADVKPVTFTLSGSSSPSMSKSSVASPLPIPDSTPPAHIPTTPTHASPEPVKSPPSKGKAVSIGKSLPVTGTRRVVASPAKSRAAVANNPSASSPPKASLQSSVSQPLRTQHTGQSIVSNPSAARQARVIPGTAPSTPSRPKSSAAQNQTLVRPKTPSSGLFAPTAASLARSRNALPPPPPPIKKVTLSSDAAERLSKPTAASLSKARVPVSIVPSTARVTKSTSVGTHGSTPRGPSKPKVGRPPVKPGESTNSKEGVTSGPASISSAPSRHSDHLTADQVENGHESGTVLFSDIGSAEEAHGHSEVAGDATHDLAADEGVHSESGVRLEQQGGEHHVEEEPFSHEHVAENLPEEAVREPEQVRLEVQEDSVPELTEPHAGEVTSNGASLKASPTVHGNDIEHIVDLLEGTSLSKPRPESMVSIPDEDGENPEY